MIEGTLDLPFKITLGDGEHIIHSDLSLKEGGSNEAMTPHRLLEASLSACTLMTMQIVAKHKNYSIGNTTVCVTVQSEGPQTIIKRTITFDPSLNDEQKEKMTVIANKCPVHRILMSDVQIPTEVIHD
ncbi:MAG: hypothetical protein COW01_14240 [Bdellovibrionales bacterium CG12_big_fil_rev_8_21_14_0_65_38_15]|nr:MAG: hypothetical protein COW79_17060 [Bdellovibrionales bacterium CG22_combo_CG10-13_8_21_14_all_38_13]PIQ53433.1 MAG: hypothetical protein COW01_14240 [Bdellovibrionales bacterium CG12_big_fil_rev_8_21_14_0_65_38_15]PIR30204.1 MAG: hypothetical protein COV38_05515 [Bdellovibrionales bacterium CG11_big_fil_rev_8_21_14_0_20_38_13]